jgi:hypothetical protein
MNFIGKSSNLLKITQEEQENKMTNLIINKRKKKLII